MTASTSAMKILIDKFMKITPWVLRTSRMRDQSLAAIYFRICMIDNANSLLQFFIIEKRAGDVHWYGISIRYTYIVRGQCGAVFCIIVNRIRFLDTISLRIILLIIRKTALPCMIPVSSAQKNAGKRLSRHFSYDIISNGVKIARASIAALCPKWVVQRNERCGRKKQEVHQHGSYFHETVT